METLGELKKLIDQLSTEKSKGDLEIWKLLNEQAADLRVLSEVVLCLSATHPNLDPVMGLLLSRKDDILSGSTPYLANLYAERLDQWHTRLLYAQRVMQGRGT